MLRPRPVLGLALVFTSLAAGALGQVEPGPTPPPSSVAPSESVVPAASQAASTVVVPNASASPAVKPGVDSSDAMNNLGQLVKDGQLTIEADLRQGQMPA